MSITVSVVIVIVAILLLFIAIRILKGCLPKILIGLLVLAAIAFLVYWYLIR